MVRSICSFVGAAVLASAILHAVRLGSAGETKEKGKLKLSANEAKVLELANEARKAKKIPPFKVHPLLMKLAREHSANMARQRKADHVLDGKNPDQRMKESGYPNLGGGENIYYGVVGSGNPEAAHKWWMNSKIHRENILEPNFTEIGIGLARDSKGIVYYTQVFGVPR
jgi:uncharacterized protein YkwD